MLYREELLPLVKSVGMEIAERADEIVGLGNALSEFSMYISFPQDGRPPAIEVTRNLIVTVNHN